MCLKNLKMATPPMKRMTINYQSRGGSLLSSDKPGYQDPQPGFLEILWAEDTRNVDLCGLNIRAAKEC